MIQATNLKNKYLSYLVIFLACFTLTFLTSSLTLLPHSSSAETAFDQYYTDIQLNISPVISLSLDQNALNMNLTPTGSGSSTYSKAVASVSTNNETGYTLNMNTEQERTSLLHTNETNSIPSTTASNDAHLDPAPLPINTWGFNHNENSDQSYSTSNYEAIPPLSNPKLINSTNTPATNSQTAITIGTKIDTTMMSGTYQNTLMFTALSNIVPTPPEFFKFTIDTTMAGAEETSFSIPTSGRVGNRSNPYTWVIDWGDDTSLEEVAGNSDSNSPGIPHTYASPGEYQITIYATGEATDGWFNAFGFSNTTGGANVQKNKNMFKSIDSRLTNLMRSSNAPNRFAKMFMGARNAITIPARFFDNIDTTGTTNFDRMFNDTFASFATNSTTATIPHGLFDSIDTSSATDTQGMFWNTFTTFAQNSTNATIPSGLFDSIDTSNSENTSNMFGGTFNAFATNSTVGTIPTGLFDSIDTSQSTNTRGMFSFAFYRFAEKSTTATIPYGLFDPIDTSNSDNTSSMFYYVFCSYGEDSEIGTIPAGLFAAINTPLSENLSDMFHSAFRDFARSSTTAIIPSGLFSSIDTTNAKDLSDMFYYTFVEYGTLSTIASIPAGIFDTIDTTNATNVSGLFNATFAGYGFNSPIARIPDNIFTSVDLTNAASIDNIFAYTFFNFGPDNPDNTTSNINNIWGAAEFAGKINAENVGDSTCASASIGSGGIFCQTFFSVESLVGRALDFTTGVLNITTPVIDIQTFTSTSVEDRELLDPNWR